MKNYPFLSIITLSITVISCTNSDTNTTGEHIDSTVVANIDSVISIPDTLQPETDTVSNQTTAVTGSKNNSEKIKTGRPDPQPCGLPLVPRFPESDQAMLDFIDEHLEYPEVAKKANISGSVLVGFKVKASGEIKDIKVLKGIGYGCDEEAIRIVKLMPKWIPGKSGGGPMDADMNIPVNFKLPD